MPDCECCVALGPARAVALTARKRRVQAFLLPLDLDHELRPAFFR